MEALANSFSSYYQGRNILITGASGYLASNIIKRLAAFDCNLYRFTRSQQKLPMVSGQANINDFVGDYCNKTIWNEIILDIDIVFHLAAQTSVYEAECSPERDYQDNVLPMRHLLEACRSTKRRPTIIFSGTSTQCGIPGHLPVDETAEDHPITFYDLHKLISENYLKYYALRGWIYGTSLRLTNIYGPGPASSNEDRGVINQMIRKALKGHPINIYGTGEFIRDYLFIDDAVNAFLSIPACHDSANGHHYLVGSGKGITIRDAFNTISEVVEKETNQKVLIKTIPPPSGLSPIESRNFVADINHINRLSNWKPITSLPSGILLTLRTFCN